MESCGTTGEDIYPQVIKVTSIDKIPNRVQLYMRNRNV